MPSKEAGLSLKLNARRMPLAEVTFQNGMGRMIGRHDEEGGVVWEKTAQRLYKTNERARQKVGDEMNK